MCVCSGSKCQVCGKGVTTVDGAGGAVFSGTVCLLDYSDLMWVCVCVCTCVCEC